MSRGFGFAVATGALLALVIAVPAAAGGWASVVDHETLPPDADAAELSTRLGALLLGAGAGSPLLSAVREETSAIADPEQRRAAVVALLVGSPEFQRQ